jgi:predicted transcriptional regulator
MLRMVDYVTPVLLAASTFFVAVSFGLLYRYRQVSQKISESTDLGRDLWSSLEQRLKKQDERILDMMARFEVVQSRVMSNQIVPQPTKTSPARGPPSSSTSDSVLENMEESAAMSQGRGSVANELHHVVSRPPPAVESQRGLDETQLAAMKLLNEKAMSTREITNILKKSREHSARVMKALFERGLVVRDDSKRPFVYQLTDEGRRYLSAT